MLLHFPQMHPDLLPPALREGLPESVRFLDPGLGKADSPLHLRPEAAPFDPRTARALLADTLRYGESVANPRDILAQGLVQQLEQAESHLAEGSRSVLAEVEQCVSTPTAPGQQPAGAQDNARRQAQMVLLLAWNLEERLLELRGIEAGLRTAWDRLGQSVTANGELADEETDYEALALGRELSGQSLPDSSSMAMPWRRLLESFAVLATDCDLCTSDAEIGAALAEAGIPEAPLDDIPGAVRVFRAQAWRFVGLDRLPGDRPWLEAPLTLGLFAPRTGAE